MKKYVAEFRYGKSMIVSFGIEKETEKSVIRCSLSYAETQPVFGKGRIYLPKIVSKKQYHIFDDIPAAAKYLHRELVKYVSYLEDKFDECGKESDALLALQ